MVRLVTGEWRQAARRVALGTLYLDDLRAEVGEQLGAVRTGDMVREVENADAL